MDTEEINKIADIIVDRHVTEEYWNGDDTIGIEYLHCSCCSTFIPCDGHSMTAPEMISIMRAVQKRLDREIEKVEKANKITRNLKNPKVY